MPILIPKSTMSQRSLQEIALVVGKDPSLNSLGTIDAAKTVMLAALKLCWEATRASKSGVAPSQESLSALKAELVNARMLLGSQADLADQLIKIYSLWSSDTLPHIADDEDFNHQLVEDAFDKYLTYMESTTPLITQEVSDDISAATEDDQGAEGSLP